MKKTIISVVIISIILNIASLPMTKVYASDDVEKNKEDSVFQKLSDVISGKYEEKTVPFKKVPVFQLMADGIATVIRGDDTK